MMILFTVTLHEPCPKRVRQTDIGNLEEQGRQHGAGLHTRAMQTQAARSPVKERCVKHLPCMQEPGKVPERHPPLG